MRPKKRILIVDNDEDSLHVCRFILRMKCYNVFSAVSCDEACRYLHDALFDLILIRYPIDGIDVILDASKLKDNRIPVIVITPKIFMLYKEVTDVFTFANFVLYKPTSAELIDKIATAIMRRRGPRPGTPRTKIGKVEQEDPVALST